MNLSDLLSKVTGKEKNEYNSRVIRHRVLMFYRTLLIIAVILAIVFSLYISYQTKEYTGYEVVSDEDRTDADEAIYIAYNENVIKYSQDGAEAYDGNNNAIWNITFEMQNPQVEVCGEYAAIGDFKGTKIYVINASGEQGEIETKLPVSTFCVSGQGVVAAVIEGDMETKINLYNSSGEILASMKCTMSKSGYPADVSLSPDGMKLGVSYMRIENGELKSSVAFYNFDEVGQNEIDNYVSGYDYIDTVVPKIKFINEETAFALGDNRFVIYKGAQKPTSTYETFLEDEVLSVYYGENTIGLVFRDSSNEGQYRIDIYNDKGEIQLSKPFDIEYTDIVLKKEYIIIYNNTDCLVYKLNGTTKFNGQFEEPMLLLVPGNRLTKWTLVNRDTVQSVKLK